MRHDNTWFKLVALVLILVLLVTILAACGKEKETTPTSSPMLTLTAVPTVIPMPTATPESEVWKTYTDPDYWYSIGYPSTFEMEALGDGLALIKSPGNTFRVTIVKMQKAGTLSSQVDSHIESMPYFGTFTYKLLARTDLLWQGIYPACELIELRNLATDTTEIMKGKTLLLLYKGLQYNVIGTAEQSVYESNSSTIDAIINSFRITN